MLCFDEDKPVIGVVHLLSLPGSPDFGDMEAAVDRALSDAESLVENGVDGLIIENYGDKPFVKKVSRMTVSSLSVVCSKIKDKFDVPIGVNVLRNDWKSALSIAKPLKLSFIRVNVYTGSCRTPTGYIEGEAGRIQRFREKYDIDTPIFADILVKHADTIYPDSIENAAETASERGLADALIVSGKLTGEPVSLEDIKKAKNTVDVPVLAGSGVDDHNVNEVLTHSDGAIIGTYFKENGITSNVVSEERVKNLMSRINEEDSNRM
ncbi:MAG: BtpA/SgcQ family protein [Candidatus Thermoplasmatota archaeon]